MAVARRPVLADFEELGCGMIRAHRLGPERSLNQIQGLGRPNGARHLLPARTPLVSCVRPRPADSKPPPALMTWFEHYACSPRLLHRLFIRLSSSR
jgi:hypothetical protein